ncbi:hypothetical protein SESBI_39922 [Sesbania bispinosa]|nr:hypothetical protein SESBI_39922 [Sesbania bispinosa]
MSATRQVISPNHPCSSTDCLAISADHVSISAYHLSIFANHASDNRDDNNRGNSRNFATEVIEAAGCPRRCSAVDEGDAGGRGDSGNVATKVTATTCARPGTTEPVVAEATTKVS